LITLYQSNICSTAGSSNSYYEHYTIRYWISYCSSNRSGTFTQWYRDNISKEQWGQRDAKISEGLVSLWNSLKETDISVKIMRKTLGSGPQSAQFNQTIPFYNKMINIFPMAHSRPSLAEYPQITENVRKQLRTLIMASRSQSKHQMMLPQNLQRS
jgi:hypothetical protein